MSRRKDAIQAEKKRLRQGQLTGLGRLVLFYEYGYKESFQIQEVAAMQHLPVGVSADVKLTIHMRIHPTMITWRTGAMTEQYIFARVEKGKMLGKMLGTQSKNTHSILDVFFSDVSYEQAVRAIAPVVEQYKKLVATGTSNKRAYQLCCAGFYEAIFRKYSFPRLGQKYTLEESERPGMEPGEVTLTDEGVQEAYDTLSAGEVNYQNCSGYGRDPS